MHVSRTVTTWGSGDSCVTGEVVAGGDGEVAVAGGGGEVEVIVGEVVKSGDGIVVSWGDL